MVGSQLEGPDKPMKGWVHIMSIGKILLPIKEELNITK